MSDATHARICIRHASGSVEIEAPAGEVTWLDLSGLHALSVPGGSGFRRKRPALKTLMFLGCFAAVGGGVWFVGNYLPAGSRAEASALERAASQQAFLPGPALPNAPQTLQGAQVPALGSPPQPAAHDADPFGLRLK